MSNNKPLMPTLLGPNGNDSESPIVIDPQNPGCSGDTSSASPHEATAAEKNHSFLSPARPDEAGAVGGKGLPSTSKPTFADAVAKADMDFKTNQQTIKSTNQKSNQHTNQLSNDLFNTCDKYPQGNLFPRFLVVKHQDKSKNIAAEDFFTICTGFKAILSERQYSTLQVQPLFRSHLLLIEVDGKPAVEKLLGTTMIGNIPVIINVHKTRNSVKGVIKRPI